MSNKLKNSNEKVERSFSRGILKKAQAIVNDYQIVIEYEDGCWYGHGLELNLAFGDGSTVEACVEETRKAMLYSVATMLERGEAPPIAAKQKKRTEQVNVRLSLSEKQLLEMAASEKGYRGISDYLRATALAATT